MPTPAYIKFTSETSGEIEGSVEIADREGTSEVHEFNHGVTFPTDVHTGLATGKRVHNPAIIVKEVDKSSPILWDHITNGTSFPEILINWYKVQKDGSEMLYYTHLFEEARIVDMKMLMPNVKDPTKQAFGHLEQISIMYRKVTWSWIDGGIEGYDDWLESQ